MKFGIKCDRMEILYYALFSVPSLCLCLGVVLSYIIVIIIIRWKKEKICHFFPFCQGEFNHRVGGIPAPSSPFGRSVIFSYFFRPTRSNSCRVSGLLLPLAAFRTFFLNPFLLPLFFPFPESRFLGSGPVEDDVLWHHHIL